MNIYEPWAIKFQVNYSDKQITDDKLKVLFSDRTFLFPDEWQMIEYLDYLLSSTVNYHFLQIIYMDNDVTPLYLEH